MSIVLRADSIGKSFGARAVLTAATLRGTAGQVTFLVGRNGCGKSTLLKVATGVIPSDHGIVTYAGRPYLRPRWHTLAARGLFYLPDRETLAATETPRYHLDAIARQFGHADHADAIEICRVGALLDTPCAALSTGERRRVEVATALARRPCCVLADEPLRNIDPKDRGPIGDAFQHLARQGCAVVVTGHDVEDLFAIADSVVWCTDGTTYELGTPEAAIDHWQFARTYLGPARAGRIVLPAPTREIS